MNKLKQLFFNKTVRLFLLTIISLVAGLYLMISPETVHHLVIRGIGLVWILEGINYLMKLYVRIKLR